MIRVRPDQMAGFDAAGAPTRAFFIFLFFISVFTKIYFRFGNLQKYTPAAPLPGGRDLAARLPGGRDLNAKKEEKNCRSLGPVARQRGGRPPLTARQRGGRLYHPYIRVGWSPHPSFVSLQFQKQRKKREGGREAKPCRIFEPATAGNQNSSTLYK